jgi:transposase
MTRLAKAVDGVIGVDTHRDTWWVRSRRGCWSCPGVGPISAAQLLVSWSHAGRLCSEATFAALAGANPIPASSGQVTRHRLNRSGDRQLNGALHTTVVARLRDDPATRAYAARRRGEGKSARDVRRCLKRAVARQLFKLLERLDRPGVELASIW